MGALKPNGQSPLRPGRRRRGVWRSACSPSAALAALALLSCACAPVAAQAAETVTLHTSFTPDRLGASTTVGFGFTIANTDGELPSPLTHIDLRMPKNMNYITSSLGLTQCEPAQLEQDGLAGCPPNSQLGYGEAYVKVPFGTEAPHEIPNIQAFMGTPRNGNIVVLFYAEGRLPVSGHFIFAAELLPGGKLFGESLDTAVPLIEGVKGTNVSIISVNSTIGPNHLTYYKRVHGRRVGYKPQGVDVPEACPHGGFRFSALFTFLDGSTVTASSAVPCPPPHHHKK